MVKEDFKCRGQVTILMALIFQVLFVFFAMVINVGLLVHHKINLQNSVDLSAYYGAMKQAEVLNAMAHVNYQIRQAWKLMNYRLWVLSNVSRNPDFVAGSFSSQPGPNESVPYTDGIGKRPLVCVGNRLWFENESGQKKAQDLCQNPGSQPPPFPELGANPISNLVTFGFRDVMANISSINKKQYENSCRGIGVQNYYMAYAILRSYKVAVARRRLEMARLQRLLINGGPTGQNRNDYQDISLAGVGETMQKVLRGNLTSTNRQSYDSDQAGAFFSGSVNETPFMVPIDVRVKIDYLDFVNDNCGKAPLDLTDTPTFGNPDPAIASQINGLLNFDVKPSAEGTDAGRFDNERNLPTQDSRTTRSLVGFEKNPWILVYTYVHLRLPIRLLFSPLLGPTTIEAKSYAMPFGGRMGPWYRDRWPSGAATSTSNRKIDELLPSRTSEGLQGGREAPNYSRFPGDKLGMISRLWQFELIKLINAGPNLNERPQFENDDYKFVFNANGVEDDPVVFTYNGNRPRVRNAELTAIAPDLFDAIYYSVTSTFSADMTRKNGTELLECINAVPGTGKFVSCADYGSRKQPARDFNISQQIDLAKGLPSAFWLVNDKAHLLTGWAQEATDNFGPDGGKSTRMGREFSEDDENLGGRSGYSVKIVSESFLNSQMPLGGDQDEGLPINAPRNIGFPFTFSN